MKFSLSVRQVLAVVSCACLFGSVSAAKKPVIAGDVVCDTCIGAGEIEPGTVGEPELDQVLLNRLVGSSLRVVDARGERIGGFVLKSASLQATVFFETRQGTFLLDIRGDRFTSLGAISYYLLLDCQGQAYADADEVNRPDRMVPFQSVVIGRLMLGPDVTAPIPSPGIASTRQGNGDCTNGLQGIETIVPLVLVNDLSEFQTPFRIEPDVL